MVHSEPNEGSAREDSRSPGREAPRHVFFSTVGFSAFTLCLFLFLTVAFSKFGHSYYSSYFCCSSHLII